ncbi:MAG: hypothetical protein M3N52_02295, partial [Actinomycetota bacterium]|nr:hypothetical protein [Actinomycetota bacterium]
AGGTPPGGRPQAPEAGGPLPGGRPQAPQAPEAGGPLREEVHVEAQVDQEVFDRLIAEGASERVARAKAKAAYVRREKQRLRAGEGSA